MSDFFARDRLVHLQIGDAFLVRFDQRRAVRFDKTIEKLFELAFGLLDRLRELDALAALRRELRVPQVAQHEGECEQPFGRTELSQQRLEFAFEDFFAHRLPMHRAAGRVAQVIRIHRVAAFRPAGREWLAAVAAGDEATQWKRVVEIGSRGHLHLAEPALLRGLPSGEADQRLMFARLENDAPFGVIHVTGIDRTRKDFDDALEMDIALAVAREVRKRLEEAGQFGHGLKPSRRIAFDAFGDDRGGRLVADQHLAVTSDTLVAIADRRARYPIAIGRAALHAILGLLGILAALVLRHGRQHVFLKLAVGIVAERNARRFQDRADTRDRCAQFDMRFHAARQPRDVVDDDGVRHTAAFGQKGEHRLHLRTLDQTPRGLVGEHADDFEAAIARILAAARLLAAQPVPLANLLHGGHATVDDSMFGTCGFHALVASPSTPPTCWPVNQSISL